MAGSTNLYWLNTSTALFVITVPISSSRYPAFAPSRCIALLAEMLWVLILCPRQDAEQPAGEAERLHLMMVWHGLDRHGKLRPILFTPRHGFPPPTLPAGTEPARYIKWFIIIASKLEKEKIYLKICLSFLLLLCIFLPNNTKRLFFGSGKQKRAIDITCSMVYRT